MKITLKNFEVANAVSGINELLNVDLPIKASWNLTKNLKKLEVVFKEYGAYRDKLLSKYATKDATGTIKYTELDNGLKEIEMSESNKEKFNSELNDLNQLESEIEFLPINIDDLCVKDEKLKIKPWVLSCLYFMFKDEV